MNAKESPRMVYVVAEGRTEIGQFALIFGQDFDLTFPNFGSAVAGYRQSLSRATREELREQLASLLATNLADDELEKAWIKLGAQWMPRGELRTLLQQA